ncbi:MAG TPA: hypothetical protein VJ248_02160 [Candidatus Udaeobacter sp.]|nr:hypothetical protein [Candidatus Udaeobacter sp.]
MEFIRAQEAADILGVSIDDARTILRFFKVETKDGPQPLTAGGKPFGKPAKLYNPQHVRNIAGYPKLT